MENILAIIPSRYASSRFPGKPLALVHGRPMVVRVVEAARRVFSNVCVATDDERILKAVEEAGYEAVMTSQSHNSGTDRCLEALEKYCRKCGKNFEVVVNVQGDEPYIRPEQLKALAECFKSPEVDIATIVKRALTVDEVTDPNRPKVVIDSAMNALYFSRSVIPFYRGGALTDDVVREKKYWLHVGLYGYKADVLKKICTLPESFLEKTEKLEQLRWLENGFKIRAAESEGESYSIDTQADLDRINKMNL